jgi:hypothetical protein
VAEDNGHGRAVKHRRQGEYVSVLEHLSIVRDLQIRHVDELRTAEERFQAERDRRLTEVNAEKEKALTAAFIAAEKALQIKETADRAALGLAREIQTYKDEKANELREQISSERGRYATKDDLAAVTSKLEAIIRPLGDWIVTQQGRAGGLNDGWKYVSGAIVIAGVIIGIAFKLTGH